MSILEAEPGALQEVEELRRQETESWRERGEEALHSSTKSWLPLIFHGVSDLLFLIGVEAGPQFRCLAVNRSHLKKTGWMQEQLVGKLIAEALPLKQAQFVIEKYTEAMRSRSPTVYEESTNVPGGRLMVETTLTPVFDEQGHCLYLLGASRGIAERKRAEEALRQAHTDSEQRVQERTAELQQANEALQTEIEERKRVEAALRAVEEDYRTLFENAVEGIYRSSLEGKQLRANPALVKLNGYNSEEQQISGVNDIATEWYVDPHRREEFARILEEQGTVTDFESEIYRHKTRERIWISETARLVYASDGTPLYYEGTVQDITTRKRAEEALHKAHAELEQRVREQTAELSHANTMLQEEIEERKRIEEALRENEERYRDLFENANDAIATFTLDGKITALNRAAERLIGWSREELIGQDLYKVATPGSVVLAEERALRFLAGERLPSPTFESELLHKDGSVVAVESRTRAIRDAAGKPVGFQGIYRDITERKSTERALRESEERYRIISQSISDYAFSFRIGDQGEPTLEWLTDSFTQVTGYPVFEVVGQPNPLSHYVHPEDLGRLLRIIKNLQPGKSITYEFRIIRKDGAMCRLQSRVQAISDETGKLVRLYGAARDITERKLADTALRESEQRYRAVVETQTELICRFLPDTTLTFVNEAYCRYFGKSRKELLGTSFLALIPEHAQPAAKAHIDSLVAHPRLVVNEHEVIAAGGDLRWQRWTDQSIVDETGQLIEFQSTGLDITERKRTEEALRQLQAELAHVSQVLTVGEMAASIAHEVNQPLGAIVGNADICLRLLASKTPDLDQVREALSDIIKDGHRASDVIARIRALVKKGALQKTSFDLNEVIREATGWSAMKYKESISDCGPTLPPTSRLHR